MASGLFLLCLLPAPFSSHWPLSAGGPQAQAASLPSVFSPQLCSHKVKTLNTVCVLMTLKCRPHSETLGCNIYLLAWHSLRDLIGVIILINHQTFSSSRVLISVNGTTTQELTKARPQEPSEMVKFVCQSLCGLIGPWGNQIFDLTLFGCMCMRYLQGCFWMRLTFELVDWVKCIALPSGIGLILSTKGLNRTKGKRENWLSLPVFKLEHWSSPAFGLGR